MGGLHGLSECLGRIDHLTESIDLALSVAALAAAKPIENAWKRNVQRVAFKTGSYLRSIHSEIVAEGKGKGSEGEDLELHIGTDIEDPPYPFFLEYGTSRMSAHPSMTPAFEDNKNKAIKEAEAVFAKVVERLTI
jgi:HK97 gp10 family phage protein